MNELEMELSAVARGRLRRKLLNWYSKNARELPWRCTRDAYRIWISEIMLQQTTVAAVVPYYERFLNRFPDVQSLAAAEEEEVLKLWEGLGYYSRGRNIWRTARRLCEESQGEFPQGVSELQSLPGIGRYTAGAIASFAFDKRAPILEANTLRLYSRIVGYSGDPKSREGQRVLWRFAEQILPRQSPGLVNQALMELGSQICTPKDPACENCPIKRECIAFANGKQAEIPQVKKRSPPTDVTEAYLGVARNGKYLLRRCQAEERWAGLWDFPRFRLEENDVVIGNSARGKNGSLFHHQLSESARSDLARQLQERTGICAEPGDFACEFRHGVTRFRIHLLCFYGRHLGGRRSNAAEVHWVAPERFGDYPLSTSARKFAEYLKNAL